MIKILLTIFLILCSSLGVWLGSFLGDFNSLATGYVNIKLSEVEQNFSVDYEITESMPGQWVNLKNFKNKSYLAIMISEDWDFYNHKGVDWDQVKIAFLDFLGGKRLRGASTITQQLIKNLYFTNERSYQRKIKELILSLLIERVLSKEKILEIYLNIIEFGDGIYGIDSASKFYFQKRAIHLEFRESSFLAMLLPNPKVYSQSFKNRELSQYARETINRILEKLKIAKVIDQEDLEKEKMKNFSWEIPTPYEKNDISLEGSDEAYFDGN